MAVYINFEHIEFNDYVFFETHTFNRAWGIEYMTMDSHSFRGGVGGGDYEILIDIYQQLWEELGYRIFFLY
jgi:hypothetical protein